MSKMSREKGKRGEREAAALLTAAGFPAHRAQQYKGSDHSADITCPTLDGEFHIEVKRVEKLSGPTWIAQCRADAPDLLPLVLFRKSKRPWHYLTDEEGATMLGIPQGDLVEVLFRALWGRYGIDPNTLETSP